MTRTSALFALVGGLILLGGNMIGSSQGQTITLKPMTPIKKVIPTYPENLKEEGIAGEVAILAMIDTKGNVREHAFVIRHLHPELDKLALEAVSQWKYQPYVFGGKPISVPTFISVVFDPGDASSTEQNKEDRQSAEEFRAEESSSDESRMILDRCAEYCRKLSDAALFYVCREKIAETVKSVEEEVTQLNIIVLENYTASARYVYPVLRRAEKDSYINEYQLIHKADKIEERRTPLEKNAGKSTIENASQTAKLPYSGNPIFIPVQLISVDRRPLFTYKIVDKERIRGNDAYLIDVKPRRKRGEGVKSSKIWVDKKTFRILRAEVEFTSPAVDEQILMECRRHNLTPHISATFNYEVEKNGILFPSRSEIRIEYTGLVRPPKDTKADIDIRYDNYRFFTVETDSKIIR